MSDQQAASSSVDVEAVRRHYAHGYVHDSACHATALALCDALERAQQDQSIYRAMLALLDEVYPDSPYANIGMLRQLIAERNSAQQENAEFRQEIGTWHKIWNDVDLLSGRVEAMRNGTADLGEIGAFRLGQPVSPESDQAQRGRGR